MKKGEKLIIAALLVISLAFLVGQRIIPAHEVSILTVEVDGVLVKEKNVTSQTNEELTIPLKDDHTATIEIRDGRARAVPMSREICPRGICSNMGWIDRPGQAIICMPNKMIIQFKGKVGGE